MNEAHISLVSPFGSDSGYILHQLPYFLSETIRNLTPSFNYSSLEDLDCFSSVYSEQNMLYSCWMLKQDTQIKRSLLNDRNNRSFTGIELRGLYDVLMNEEAFGTETELIKQCCVLLDTDNEQNILQCIQNLDILNENKLLWMIIRFQMESSYSSVPNEIMIGDIQTLLCLDPVHSCFLLSELSNSFIASMTIQSLYEYICIHLLYFVYHKALISTVGPIILTAPQSQHALFTTTPILEHHRDLKESLPPVSIISVYNCYDSKEAKTNFMIQCKNI